MQAMPGLSASVRQTADQLCPWLIATLCALWLSPTVALAAPNVLSLSNMTESYGVLREQRLVDGLAPAPDSPIDDFVAALFLGANSRVRFDLGDIHRIEAIQLLALDDSIVVEVSEDGQVFEPVVLTGSGRVEPMEVFLAVDLDLRVRYLQVEVSPWRSRGAVGEILAFESTPDHLPVNLENQTPPTYKEATQQILDTERLVSRLMLGLALVALILLLWAQASHGRRRVILCLALVAISAAGWLRLGTLRVDGTWIHAWDLMHYQLGAKYFEELGYRDLYRCAAEWEQQRGRAVMVDRTKIRDLDDNQLYPGSWASTPEGACRAEFSDDRWQAFGADLDGVRRLFKFRRLHQALRDHGYNATPPQTLVLNTLVGSLEAKPGTLLAFSLLDVAALAAAVGCLWWAFGPLVGATGALLIGFGDPWGFSWTGGSVGRFFWLFALCAGLALIAKRRWVSGSMLVTVGGLLRLFPLVLLAGPVVWAIRAWLQGQKDAAERKVATKLVVGVAVTLIVGLLLPAIVYGFDVYSEFFDNSRIHATVPPSNHMGFGVLASAGLEGSAFTATTPWRLVAWLLALGGSFVWLAWALSRPRESHRPRQPWETVAMSAPLLFASIPLSSYDYVWLVILAPLAVQSRTRLLTLLGFVAFTNFLPEIAPEGKVFYLLASAGLLIVLIVFCFERKQDTRASEHLASL